MARLIVEDEFKIIDNFNRQVLMEGRNFGVGFSVIKKNIKEKEYSTLHAFTACKDYLNDFSYIEMTGNPLSEIHGFEHEYTGVFKDKKYFYLGVKPLHYLSGNNYPKYNEIKENLLNNSKNYLKLINKVEDYLGVKYKTKVEYIQEDTVIFKASIFWLKFSFLISLYTFLFRYFINITKEQNKLSLNELFQRDEHTPIILGDLFMIETISKIFNTNIFERLCDYEYPKKTNSSFIHNFGIIARINYLSATGTFDGKPQKSMAVYF